MSGMPTRSPRHGSTSMNRLMESSTSNDGISPMIGPRTVKSSKFLAKSAIEILPPEPRLSRHSSVIVTSSTSKPDHPTWPSRASAHSSRAMSGVGGGGSNSNIGIPASVSLMNTLPSVGPESVMSTANMTVSPSVVAKPFLLRKINTAPALVRSSASKLSDETSSPSPSRPTGLGSSMSTTTPSAPSVVKKPTNVSHYNNNAPSMTPQAGSRVAVKSKPVAKPHSQPLRREAPRKAVPDTREFCTDAEASEGIPDVSPSMIPASMSKGQDMDLDPTTAKPVVVTEEKDLEDDEEFSVVDIQDIELDEFAQINDPVRPSSTPRLTRKDIDRLQDPETIDFLTKNRKSLAKYMNLSDSTQSLSSESTHSLGSVAGRGADGSTFLTGVRPTSASSSAMFGLSPFARPGSAASSIASSIPAPPHPTSVVASLSAIPPNTNLFTGPSLIPRPSAGFGPPPHSQLQQRGVASPPSSAASTPSSAATFGSSVPGSAASLSSIATTTMATPTAFPTPRMILPHNSQMASGSNQKAIHPPRYISSASVEPERVARAASEMMSSASASASSRGFKGRRVRRSLDSAMAELRSISQDGLDDDRECVSPSFRGTEELDIVSDFDFDKESSCSVVMFEGGDVSTEANVVDEMDLSCFSDGVNNMDESASSVVIATTPSVASEVRKSSGVAPPSLTAAAVATLADSSTANTPGTASSVRARMGSQPRSFFDKTRLPAQSTASSTKKRASAQPSQQSFIERNKALGPDARYYQLTDQEQERVAALLAEPRFDTKESIPLADGEGFTLSEALAKQTAEIHAKLAALRPDITNWDIRLNAPAAQPSSSSTGPALQPSPPKMSTTGRKDSAHTRKAEAAAAVVAAAADSDESVVRDKLAKAKANEWLRTSRLERANVQQMNAIHQKLAELYDTQVYIMQQRPTEEQIQQLLRDIEAEKNGTTTAIPPGGGLRGPVPTTKPARNPFLDAPLTICGPENENIAPNENELSAGGGPTATSRELSADSNGSGGAGGATFTPVNTAAAPAIASENTDNFYWNQWKRSALSSAASRTAAALSADTPVAAAAPSLRSPMYSASEPISDETGTEDAEERDLTRRIAEARARHLGQSSSCFDPSEFLPEEISADDPCGMYRHMLEVPSEDIISGIGVGANSVADLSEMVEGTSMGAEARSLVSSEAS